MVSALLLLGVSGLLSELTGATGDLSLPCRSWTSCGEPICTSEEEFQRGASLNFPSDCSGVSSGVSSSPRACVPVDGVCNFTDEALSCRSWVPDCTYSHRCSTEEEYQQYLNFSTTIDLNCPPVTSPLPAPDAVCTQIDGECKWYDPCRTWRSLCLGPYLCGNSSEFWAYQFGPVAGCLPDQGQEHVPPGVCVLQDDQCGWSGEPQSIHSCRSQSMYHAGKLL